MASIVEIPASRFVELHYEVLNRYGVLVNGFYSSNDAEDLADSLTLEEESEDEAQKYADSLEYSDGGKFF